MKLVRNDVYSVIFENTDSLEILLPPPRTLCKINITSRFKNLTKIAQKTNLKLNFGQYTNFTEVICSGDYCTIIQFLVHLLHYFSVIFVQIPAIFVNINRVSRIYISVVYIEHDLRARTANYRSLLLVISVCRRLIILRKRLRVRKSKTARRVCKPILEKHDEGCRNRDTIRRDRRDILT